jgi:anti-sigma regulatory factor (Ser/Thr protein kinase)
VYSTVSDTAVSEKFLHRAVFYEGTPGLVDLVTPFIREGVERGEPVLVAELPANSQALKEALGADAERVTFMDMAELGGNPARIIPAWQHFVDECAGGQPARGVGEPVWRGRRPAELEECRLHEALLNVAFDGGPAWQLLCPYDVSALSTRVVEDAMRTHPTVEPSPGPRTACYGGHDQALREFGRVLPSPPPDAAEVRFGEEDLSVLRQVVRRLGETSGLSDADTDDLVLAAHELASNSVLHGGGGGTLRGWRTPHSLVVELSDSGVIEDPLAGREWCSAFDESGRGLWIANQLCDLVQLRSSGQGTVVRLFTWL